MDERELAATVKAAQSGDTMAMDALVDELMPYVGRICGGIALERGDDATQETLIAMLRGLPKLREPAAVRGWVRRIAAREAVRIARDARRRPVAEPSQDVAAPGDPSLVVEVRDQLARMEPAQRAVLAVRALGGLGGAEVAGRVGVGRGTVKSRLHRARSRFGEGWSG